VNSSWQRRGYGDSPIRDHSPHSCQTIVTQLFNPHLDRQMPMAGKDMIRVDIVRLIAENPTIIRSDEMQGTNFSFLPHHNSKLLAQHPTSTSRFKGLQYSKHHFLPGNFSYSCPYRQDACKTTFSPSVGCSKRKLL
jgi:hypothetical protein